MIKPAARYGGQGVTVGRHTPPKAWQEVLKRALQEQNWLVQEYCESLKQFIHERAARYGLSLSQARNYKQAFVEFIEKLSVRGKIVILIDEYDKSIIDFVENQEIARQNRDILKNFYSTLKGLDEYLKFVFITGVLKFSKVSVFSDLNNLNVSPWMKSMP